jgi:hypothetical protein
MAGQLDLPLQLRRCAVNVSMASSRIPRVCRDPTFGVIGTTPLMPRVGRSRGCDLLPPWVQAAGRPPRPARGATASQRHGNGYRGKRLFVRLSN